MFSLADHLQALQTEPSVGHGVKHNNLMALPFSPGAQVLAMGHYLVNYNAGPSEQLTAVNLHSGQPLSCKMYTHEDFQPLAPLLFKGVDGVHPILDVVKLEDKVFVFSNKPYGDLHNFLKQRKKLSEREAADIFRQIVLLVRDAHQKGIVLRDLKLKKFVFENPEQSILSLLTLDDAHLHKSSDELTDRHGCPAYICPEMLHPGSYSGRASDLWSLGIILYTLLVGHYPFFDANPQTLFAKIRSGYYPMPEHISLLGRSVISSLLAYEPEKRVPAAALLEHPWFKKASEDPGYLLPVPLADQTVPAYKIC